MDTLSAGAFADGAVGSSCGVVCARAGMGGGLAGDFHFDRVEQPYTVPSGVLVEGVLVDGASGGSEDAQPGYTTDQYGAALQGYLQTTPGDTLYAEVGQNGTAGGGATFGGGGAAGGGNDNPTCSSNGDPCSGAVAGSGGGASDVRACSMFAVSCSGGGSSLDSRLIVAAGGGGDGAVSAGGCASGEGFEGAGEGQNNQLPTASSAGPAAVDTKAGIVIPGFAGGDLSSVTTVDGITNAAMGATAAGAGGSFTGCAVNGVAGSRAAARGRRGRERIGGAGGEASAVPGCRWWRRWRLFRWWWWCQRRFYLQPDPLRGSHQRRGWRCRLEFRFQRDRVSDLHVLRGGQ